MNYADKVVVVTGAAGNLGKAVVEAFLKAGAQVCALDHGKGRLAGVSSAVEPVGQLHIYEAVDVLDRKGLIGLAENIRNDVGRVEILVHTVGGYAAGEPVHELSYGLWQKMMDLNVHSFLNASAVFVPGMLEAGQGKIITVGSKSALSGGAKGGAYAASKGALLRLTESMAAELGAHNIQVNCVLPSTIDTPENRQAMPNADFFRWVPPEKIAEVILFLASPAADAINGAAVPVFG